MELIENIIALRDEYKDRKYAAFKNAHIENATFFAGGQAACNRILLIAEFHLNDTRDMIRKSYGMTEHE